MMSLSFAGSGHGFGGSRGMSTQPPHVAAQGQSPESRRWHFANAVLDDRTFELTVDGAEVEIERKPFEVLRFLLQHAGEVVTKDELLAGVWPGRFLSETVLTKCVGRLREVLRDDDQTLIKTVYGYGYRFMAPVRIELQRAPEPAHFDFKEGDHPRERPLWSLIRRLGSGGHGEAWLARHDKTRDQRVFKFAIDEPSLAALKREITLFRFLNDSLGERARVVPLLDWNLEHPPCFIEMEYIAGGSLVEWAERSGGLSKVPLATRIEIAAQIAEALAAVHSVGVLHKDLKPSNVLIESDGTIRLADFGSGGVLDPKKLEALGITRLGFTKTVAAVGTSGGGTLMYAAPELLGGQPPTVKADIYALGVMLYQLVVGEFRKGMAAGWEHEIKDELLRECIAQAADGESQRRSGDAGAVAVRLRTLDDERERRNREREAKARAEALERALATAKASQAVAEFLSRDMFSVVGSKPLRDLTAKELLEAASTKLADRFQEMPLAAAKVHAALGGAFWTMEMVVEADRHLDHALTIYEQLGAAGCEDAIGAVTTLVGVKFTLGTLQAAMPRYQAALAAAQVELPPLHPGVIGLKSTLAQVRLLLGDWRGAAADFEELVAQLRSAGSENRDLLGNSERTLGYCLLHLAELEPAEQALTSALQRFTASQGSQAPTADARALRAMILAELERFDEAEVELQRALQLIRAWAPDDMSARVLSVQWGQARLRLRQGRCDQAIEILESALRTLDESRGRGGADHTAEWRLWLAHAYRDAGRVAEAEAGARAALVAAQTAWGSAHPIAQSARITLADTARLRGDAAAAHAALAAVDRNVIGNLGPIHPYAAELRRVEGLTAAMEGNDAEAQRALSEAREMLCRRYGPGHGLARRAEAELASVISRGG